MNCSSFLYRFIGLPKKALRFLQDKGLVGKTAKEVAEFLHHDDRLDRVWKCYPATPHSLLPHLPPSCHTSLHTFTSFSFAKQPIIHSLFQTAIGEILGESDEFCKEVMCAYIDFLDFNGMMFLSALRLLLMKFRLPGESQKIDRIMEKFASRFCETNPRYTICINNLDNIFQKL